MSPGLRRLPLRALPGVLAAVFSLAAVSLASPILLSNVPAYDWYHGCGPTAAGMIVGYWDLHGYSNLFTASGSDVYLTSNVQDQISSPEHNAKYDSYPDDPNLPVPAYTSIADWFHTSVGSLDYGASYLFYSDDVFTGYTAYRGYTFTSTIKTYNSNFFWTDLVSQINAGDPVLFLVDSDGNGSTDHFVPVFGYEDRGADGLWYASYNTWHEDETINWYQFRGMGSPFGIGYATYCTPVSAPVPEPSGLILLACGLSFCRIGRRRS